MYVILHKKHSYVKFKTVYQYVGNDENSTFCDGRHRIFKGDVKTLDGKGVEVRNRR